MPYMDSPVKEGDEWCNYKQNPDGSRGEKVGCSDTEEKAKSALRALNMAMAEENKEVTGKEVVRLTQMEVNYTSVSTTRGKACGNCRWFAKEGYEGDMEEEIEGGYCHQVNNWPDDILSNGYCDRWEEKPGMEEPEPLPVVIVEDQRAIEDEPEPEVEYTYAVPNSNQKGFLQSLKERFSSTYKPGQTLFRDAEGRRYMFIVTSNSYADRENEAIATKALERYVDSCWLADDYFKSNNVHQVWHHDGLTVGDIVWADMSGPFLLEISKERGDRISKAAWDYWESDEGSKDLGASHRFLYRKQDKSADGTLSLISKFETTTLPRQAAAANLLTFSGVIPMSKSRDEYLDKMFGVEGVAELLKEGPQKLAEKLEAAGVQHKSTDEPTPEEAVQNAEQNFGALLLQMIESQADILARFDDQQTAAEQKSLAQTTRLDDLQEALKALAADNETLREEMKHSPRASQAAATTVQDDALQAEIENKSTSWDPAFPGMQVPLEK